jgi:hypothetical protein
MAISFTLSKMLIPDVPENTLALITDEVRLLGQDILNQGHQERLAVPVVEQDIITIGCLPHSIGNQGTQKDIVCIAIGAVDVLRDDVRRQDEVGDGADDQRPQSARPRLFGSASPC